MIVPSLLPFFSIPKFFAGHVTYRTGEEDRNILASGVIIVYRLLSGAIDAIGSNIEL